MKRSSDFPARSSDVPPVAASSTLTREGGRREKLTRSAADTALQNPPWIRAATSGIHGRGVFARTAITDGTRVIEYVGERITKAEAARREQDRLADLKRGGDGCVTIFELNERYDLDGRDAPNVARFINHSCKPNCRAEPIRGRIWIVARRDIETGEELTFDYGYGFKDWHLHPCRCGTPHCVGYIVGSAQRWRVRRLLRRLKRERALPRAA